MPLIVTAVALVAITVNVDELPVVIDVGLASMVTVGAGGAAVHRNGHGRRGLAAGSGRSCGVGRGHGRADGLGPARRLQV